MSDLTKTIKIQDLPETMTIKDTDMLIIENGSVTHKVTGATLLSYISNYTEANSDYVEKSSIGEANGVAPLDGDKKIPTANLNFGTATGTIYDGGKGKILQENLDTHIADTSLHHNHDNQSVLDTITQEKINQWDSGTSDDSNGITSLNDLNITATSDEINVLDGMTVTTTELNYMSGATSNIQTQLNTLTASVNEKSDVNHTQSASTITNGTLGGQIVTPEGTDYDTNRVRNIVLVSTDPSAGTTSDYVNGTIICVYE